MKYLCIITFLGFHFSVLAASRKEDLERAAELAVEKAAERAAERAVEKALESVSTSTISKTIREHYSSIDKKKSKRSLIDGEYHSHDWSSVRVFIGSNRNSDASVGSDKNYEGASESRTSLLLIEPLNEFTKAVKNEKEISVTMKTPAAIYNHVPYEIRIEIPQSDVVEKEMSHRKKLM